MNRLYLALILLLTLALSSLISCTQNNWIPLIEGSELPGYSYLGKPHSSIQVEGLQRDSLGNYTEGLGLADPLGVFSVVELNGEHVIRISGEVIGGLVLSDSMENFHLKLKFKWGNHKWAWMHGRPKDGGILYHQGIARHEFQIHENDVGSYWSRKVILDVPASYSHDLPQAIIAARPYLEKYVSSLTDSMLVFDPNAPPHHFNGSKGRKDWQIVIANPYNESQHGDWNTLELICWDNHAAHVVNGKLNMVVLNSQYRNNDQLLPLSKGRLTLQSEGAELFFRDIKYKKLEQTPDILLPFLIK